MNSHQPFKKALYKHRRLLPIYLIGIYFLVSQVMAQGIELREGVIIDPDRQELYFTTTDNKVEALSFEDGRTLWTTTNDARPLAIRNSRLICQTRSADSENELAIFELSLARKGKVSREKKIGLPEGVRTGFLRGPRGGFKLQARIVRGETVFSWDYQQQPFRGIKTENYQVVRRNGALKIEKNTGKTSTIDPDQLPASFRLNPINVPDQSRLPNIKGTQFRSKDGKHVLVSTRIAEDLQFNNWKWEVYEQSSGTKVGEIMNYRSYAPFHISGTTLIYEVGPYLNRVGGQIQSVPLKLLATNLSNGSELWSREIMDFESRGPTPP